MADEPTTEPAAELPDDIPESAWRRASVCENHQGGTCGEQAPPPQGESTEPTG